MMGSEATPTFAALLREYRLADGLTEQELGARAGISAAGIENLERGAVRPLRDTARQLASALALADSERAHLLAALPRTVFAPPPPGPHNLPAASTSFVGRTREQARIREVLADTRLLSVTGAAGVGKTRLALAVAEGLIDSFPDGVRLVALEPLTAPAQPAEAVARALGLPDDPDRPLLSILQDHLRGKRLLLLLDHVDQLIEPSASLAGALLQSCPTLTILATGREALRVAGERRFRVFPLTAPEPGRPPAVEQLRGYEAVRLFVARLQERRAGFVLTARNARAVATICTLLDGLPLAVELAAAAATTLPVEALAAQLDERFRRLLGGERGLSRRRQTLGVALGVSYDLLDPGAQLALRCLAMLSNAWTLDRAETACSDAGIAAGDVLELLSALVDRYLVQVEDSDQHESSYLLPEPVRRYVREGRDPIAAEQT